MTLDMNFFMIAGICAVGIFLCIELDKTQNRVFKLEMASATKPVTAPATIDPES